MSENFVTIGSGRLTAEVGLFNKYITRRQRFDWTGFVPQMYMNGKFFGGTELAPGEENITSDGAGLCAEFLTAEGGPLGYDESDRTFIKPGIGILKAPADCKHPGAYWVDNEVVELFPCTTTVEKDCVTFRLDPVPFRGYAFRQLRQITVLDDTLICTTTMKNVGEKALHLREFNHNFLNMNGLGTRPGLILTMHPGYYHHMDKVHPACVNGQRSLTFNAGPERPFMIMNPNPIAHSPLRWELQDVEQGMKMQEWGDLDISGYNTWGKRWVISPEIFVNIDLEPGESRTWTRMWRFEA